MIIIIITIIMKCSINIIIIVIIVIQLKQSARAQSWFSARPSVREVPSSIPGDITSLFQLGFFLCSFD